jgi:hypothetical protein
LEIKVREQEAFPNQEVMPDLGFIAFLRAFGESWLTKMSGPLTVPFSCGQRQAESVYTRRAIRAPESNWLHRFRCLVSCLNESGRLKAKDNILKASFNHMT